MKKSSNTNSNKSAAPMRKASAHKASTRSRKKTSSLFALSSARRLSLNSLLVALAVWLVLSLSGLWFSHHPKTWIDQQCASIAAPFCNVLLYFGDRTRLFTDSIGLTGHDVVYETDEPAPSGQVFFAGAPVRIGPPAPNDIVTVDKGEFVVGFSPSLRHPMWCAYHIPAESRFKSGKRPGFAKDKTVKGSPNPNDYARSGYDRGHMVPNHAVATRFGPDIQRNTFYMSNIVPQTPELNRGSWKRLELLIADYLTANYGECWVLVGTIPSRDNHVISHETNIDVPDACWMVVAAYQDSTIRVFAIVLPQIIDYDAFAFHYLVSVDELEQLTGLDFFPEMPEFLQRPLEADHPTRFWPVSFFQALQITFLRFS